MDRKEVSIQDQKNDENIWKTINNWIIYPIPTNMKNKDRNSLSACRKINGQEKIYTRFYLTGEPKIEYLDKNLTWLLDKDIGENKDGPCVFLGMRIIYSLRIDNITKYEYINLLWNRKNG